MLYLLQRSRPHEHLLSEKIHILTLGSIITFEKGYVDYAQYEVLTQKKIRYVTRLMNNVLYQARQKYEIPDGADAGVVRDDESLLYYGESNQESIVLEG